MQIALSSVSCLLVLLSAASTTDRCHARPRRSSVQLTREGRRLFQEAAGLQEEPTLNDAWHQQFHTYNEIVDRMLALDAKYAATGAAGGPGVSAMKMRKKTAEGRDIWYMRIRGPASPNRKVVLVGLQHAREWLAASTAMYAAERVLEDFSTSSEVHTALTGVELVIVPVLNPDGLEFTFSPTGSECSTTEQYAGSCDRFWRKTRQPLSDSPCVGIDLNRAWPVDWGSRGGEGVSGHPCELDYHGEHPLQPPEAMALCETLSELQGVDENQLCRNNSRALKDESRRPAEGLPSEGIVGVLDMHSYGQMVLGSWAHLNLKPADHKAHDVLGGMIVDAVNADCDDPECKWIYGSGDADGQLYLTSGTLPDWTYWAFGAASYTMELPPKESEDGGFAPSSSKMLEYAARVFPGIVEMMNAVQRDWRDDTAYPAVNGKYDSLSERWVCDDGGDGFLLEVATSLDLYPREFSWEVVGPSGERLAGWSISNGAHRIGKDFAAGGIMQMCSGVYTVVLRDSAGDGICCGHGHGKTSVAGGGQPLYTASGDFGDIAVVLVGLGHFPVARGITSAAYADASDLKQAIDSLYTAMAAEPDTHHLFNTPSMEPQAVGVLAAVSAAAGAALFCVALVGLLLILRRRRRRGRVLAAVQTQDEAVQHMLGSAGKG